MIAGKYAYQSLNKATHALKKGEIDVLVTAPINKANIQKSQTEFLGHTEYLGQQFDDQPLMIMLSEEMKIAFVTGHIPLTEVANSISEEKFLQKLSSYQNHLLKILPSTNQKLQL